MICTPSKSLRTNEWRNICCTCVLYEHISLPSLTFVRCQATSSAPECNSAFSALFTLFTLFTPIIALSTSLHTSGNCIDLKEPHSSTFTKTKADIYVLLDLLASEEKKENRFSLFPLQHLVSSELNLIYMMIIISSPQRRSCKFFLAGVNFYRFNAKSWHFWQILREKVAFFYRFNAKNWRFSV